jgi:hypothetical protein
LGYVQLYSKGEGSKLENVTTTSLPNKAPSAYKAPLHNKRLLKNKSITPLPVVLLMLKKF